MAGVFLDRYGRMAVDGTLFRAWARLYGQHLYGPHFSGNFMLNRVSRYNKYSALLINVILFSSLITMDLVISRNAGHGLRYAFAALNHTAGRAATCLRFCSVY